MRFLSFLVGENPKCVKAFMRKKKKKKEKKGLVVIFFFGDRV